MGAGSQRTGLKLRLVAISVLGIVGFPCAAPAHSGLPLPHGCLSVLFVGDSVTYVNNMPEIVSQIARSKNRCVQVAMVASGGESLRDHWESGDVKRHLQAQRWNDIVFQDQSTFGKTYLVDGEYRAQDARDLFVYGHRLFAIARDHGAHPILFLPWAVRSAPGRDVQFTRWAYSTFAKNENAQLVSAMDAWAIAQRRLPDINLYSSDGLHPTAAGSYLTAALFYAALVKESPVGATGTTLGPAVDFQSGRVVPGTTVLLTDLPPSIGSRLQKVALEVAQRGRQTPPLKPSPIPLPKVRRGEKISIGCLAGRWAGSSRVYPYAATMTLDIRTHPLIVEALVDFGGHPDAIHFTDYRPKLAARSLIFTDARGPNGGYVRYTAALERNVLSGIGEIIVPRYPIYGIGTWSTQRSSTDCSAAR
jgi:hypothetical protein